MCCGIENIAFVCDQITGLQVQLRK